MPYYDEVAIKGAEQGILCFGHDHTGHGQSSGDRVQVHIITWYIIMIIAVVTGFRYTLLLGLLL